MFQHKIALQDSLRIWHPLKNLESIQKNDALLTTTQQFRQLQILHKNRGGSGTSLVVQWLTLHAPNAGGLGSISLVRKLDPTHSNERSCTPQGRSKILWATTKTQYSQINLIIVKKKKNKLRRSERSDTTFFKCGKNN